MARWGAEKFTVIPFDESEDSFGVPCGHADCERVNVRRSGRTRRHQAMYSLRAVVGYLTATSDEVGELEGWHFRERVLA